MSSYWYFFLLVLPPSGVCLFYSKALPVDPTVVRNLRSLRKAETDWNALLDPGRCYRFAYALQVTFGGGGGGGGGSGGGGGGVGVGVAAVGVAVVAHGVCWGSQLLRGDHSK